MAKRFMELIEARGRADLEKTICSSCVSDAALVQAVKNLGGAETCSYCEEAPTSPVASAPMEVVLELVVDGFRHEYEDPVEQMAWDDGYVGKVYDTWDLIWELDVSERSDVQEDIVNAIQQDQWCQRNPYAATPAEALTWGWAAFRKFVKHRRRFTFLVRDHSTAEGAGEIPMHAMPAAIADAVADAGLIEPHAGDNEWWRVRVHAGGESYSSAADLGTPPDKLARDNRMSPKGIGAFYGASTQKGARDEVGGYAEPDEEGSVGLFRTVVPFDIVDLRELPAVPSLFDADRRHLRAPIQFLHAFVEDATKIADPSDTHDLDYVPTQVVAETFRYELAGNNGPVAGVLWRSSRDPSVTSCVLFIPSDEVADKGRETDRTRLVLDPATVGHITAPL